MAKVAFVWKAGVQAAFVAVLVIGGVAWFVLSRTRNADHHEIRILASQAASLASEAATLDSSYRDGELPGLFARQHARQLQRHSADLHKKITNMRTGASLSGPKRELELISAQLAASLSAAPGIEEAPFVLLEQRADEVDQELPRDPP